jgi:hypothetical protein
MLKFLEDILRKRRERQEYEAHCERQEYEDRCAALLTEGAAIFVTSYDLRRRGVTPPPEWTDRIDAILRELEGLR